MSKNSLMKTLEPAQAYSKNMKILALSKEHTIWIIKRTQTHPQPRFLQ